MDTYTAPTKDILFALYDLAGMDTIARLPEYADATRDIVEAVLAEAAAFAGEKLAPLNRIGDRVGSRIEAGGVVTADGFADAWHAYVAAGWPALAAPIGRGGQGLPQLLAVATNEIWQSANMAFALCPMITQAAVVAIEAHATPELQARFVPKLVSGNWTGCMNLTEPQAGSDLAAIKTRAVPAGDHYLITGQKIFITWGDQDFSENIVHLVLARLPDAPAGTKGISMFLVPKYLVNADGTPGARNDVQPVAVEHKLGIHASPTCVMNYGDQGGAIGYLIGAPHDGLSCMFTMMNRARLAVGMQGLCISERAYQQALAYAKERVQGHAGGGDTRVTIIHHADVRRMLMLMKAGIEAMRAFCYSTAAALDRIACATDAPARQREDARFSLLTPVLKGWCTELAQELTSLGIQIHGGMGYIEETGAAQHFRDARITTIYEGTTAIQAMDLLGRKVLRDSGRALESLLAEMHEVEAELARTDDDRLHIVHRSFERGLALLQAGSAWLFQNHPRDSHAAGAVAVNFLMLLGTVCGGWQLGRAALIAHARLQSDSIDRNWLDAKITTACFYAEHILPRCDGYLQALLAGSARIMELGIDDF